LSDHTLKSLLAESGYALSFHRDQWTECFASNATERWRGQGLDEHDALDDLLRKMFPSSLARRLLDARTEVPARPAAPPPPEPALPVAAAEPAAPVAVAEPEPAPPVAVAAPEPAPPVAVAAPEPEPPAAVAVPEPEPPVAVMAPEPEPPVMVAAPDPEPEPDAPEPVSELGLSVGAKSDRAGSVLSLPARGLFAVVDDLGEGTAAGYAARLALEALREEMTEGAVLSPVRRKAVPVLVLACERANLKIFEAARHNAAVAGARTSLAVALAVGRQVVLAHVGDSRVYRLRRGVLALLTEDHASAGVRTRSGKPAPVARAKVTRAIGGKKTLQVETSVTTAQPGDVILLSTAGLHSAVAQADLAAALKQEAEPDAVAAALVSLARGAAGQGEASAVVIRWPATMGDTAAEPGEG
jgi:PPM family protein phosphatase